MATTMQVTASRTKSGYWYCECEHGQSATLYSTHEQAIIHGGAACRTLHVASAVK